MLAVVHVSLKRNFTGPCNATHIEKAILQKCVQSPAQITAPGFVLGDVLRFCYGGPILHQDASGADGNRGKMFAFAGDSAGST
jgi:hypothetical protein